MDHDAGSGETTKDGPEDERKMLRKILGLGRTRTVRVAAANEGADAESSISSDTEGGG